MPFTASVSLKLPGEADEVKSEAATAGADGSFVWDVTRTLERVTKIDLLQHLLGAAHITVYNNAAKTKDAKGKESVGLLAAGTAKIDMSPLVRGATEVGGPALVLEALTAPGADGAPESLLLPGATLSLTITVSAPLVTPEEAERAAVLTVRVASAAPVPPPMATSSAANADPYTVTAVLSVGGRHAVVADGAVHEDRVAWEAGANPLYLSGAEVAWLKVRHEGISGVPILYHFSGE